MKKYTIAFDLDGTLCEHIRYNHPEDILRVKPKEKKVNDLKELKSRGHTIIIFTRRGVLKTGRKLTKKWLAMHDIPYDKLITRKPHWDVLVDDRVMSVFRSGFNADTILNQIKYINIQKRNDMYKPSRRKK